MGLTIGTDDKNAISAGTSERIFVSVHRAPHLLCCRALEVQKYVCEPDALHLRHPVNAYYWVV